MEAHTKLAIVTMVLVAAMGFKPYMANGEHQICGLPISELMSCEPAVVGPEPAEPSASCCAALNKVTDLQCFCKFKSSKPTFIPIDPGLAMQLPVKCHLVQSFQCA